MYDLAILGGNVALSDSVEVADVLIKDGAIAQVLPASGGDGAPARAGVHLARAKREVDARGMLVMPGVIDPHVHFGLRSRGTVTADDFVSGTRCAAAGGVTTVIDYADHVPKMTLLQCAEARLSEIRPLAAVDYSVHQNCIRIDADIGDQLAELRRGGIASAKVFTTYKDAGYMLEGGDLQALLREAKCHGVLVTVHAEDDALIEQARSRLEAFGRVSPTYHGESRPAEAEERAVGQVIAAAKAADAPVYIVHVSTGGAVRAIAEARREGQEVLAETCPHYLLLDEGRYAGADARLFIMSPPLRTKADQDALWAGAAGGDIDTFSTDHCAFTPDQKALGRFCFDTLPGIPGVQTLLPLIYTYAVATGTITVGQMVKMMCDNPARLFGMSHRKGRIAPGLDADIVILDTTAQHTLNGSELLSEAGYTPYEGMKAACRVREVFLRGNLVAAHGRFCGADGAGEFVRASQHLPR